MATTHKLMLEVAPRDQGPQTPIAEGVLVNNLTNNRGEKNESQIHSEKF